MDYTSYPVLTVEDIARIRRRIEASGIPQKSVDRNLVIGTWNIRAFGAVNPTFDEIPDGPRRNLRALASIAEVISRYDVIAIQEVKRDLSGLRQLIQWLGPDWDLFVTDVCVGDEGNDERLAYLYDRRRVTPSGLAGEIVLPPGPNGDPSTQFSRPPYLVGFRSRSDSFSLLTAHIKYGDVPEDRIEEIRSMAHYAAKELRKRTKTGQSEEANLIVLGDFNIDERGDNPLFVEFRSTGLTVPPQLENLRTTFGTKPKYYDQIAWFMGDMSLSFLNAGVIDFAGAVFPELTLRQVSYRLSDHLPLWAEFQVDHSVEQMAKTLGIDPAMPDPLGGIS